MSPDFFLLRWPKRPTRHTIGKKNQNLSNRPIKAVNGTRKSENRPKRPKIGQQVRIQSGRKCWPPSILLKLLTFLGYPTLHWCSHKPIPLIFCCSWRNDFPRYCYLKLQWLKEGTEKMHSPWRWLFSFFIWWDLSTVGGQITELLSMCLILFSPSKAVSVHIRTPPAAPLWRVLYSDFLIIFL